MDIFKTGRDGTCILFFLDGTVHMPFFFSAGRDDTFFSLSTGRDGRGCSSSGSCACCGVETVADFFGAVGGGGGGGGGGSGA